MFPIRKISRIVAIGLVLFLLTVSTVAAGDGTGVVVRLFEEGIPVKIEWPAQEPRPVESYETEALAFVRTPQKYVETGIRGDRANPYLLRAETTAELPAGKHRVLLRGRGACRLWIDGKLILSLPFPGPITDGHNPIKTDYLDLGPDFRFAPPGNNEKWVHFVSPGGKHRVKLETIIGGQRGKALRRPELGETVAAVAPQGSSRFFLLGPRPTIPYTDAGFEAFAAREDQRLDRLEDRRRREAFAAHAPAWEKRHAEARAWLQRTPDVQVPDLPAGFPAHNAIDHFLAAQAARARKEAKGRGSIDFHAQIKPILDNRCASCHAGAKVKGGLRLDNFDNARAGGNSDQPALVPGQPEKSTLIERLTTTEKGRRMPPTGDPLPEKEIALLRKWIAEGGHWPAFRLGSGKWTGLTDDLTFLRRVTLDTVGVVPTPAEIDAFLKDDRPDKRARAIDRLLADRRWADHWTGYWQDVLAENPNILNPTLNNTGPFRWWIHESMVDDKPMDLFATELVLMRGSHHAGGPKGFEMASQNDAPMAEKAAIVASAFLAVQMKCARCHDAPGHRSTQKDLFGLSALLAEKAMAVPKTSTVPMDKLHQGRKPLVQVTLKPGVKVPPTWPFRDFVAKLPAGRVPAKASPREMLAAYLTGPENERFAQVLANRVWKRLIGRGLVEPVDDWEKGTPSHPELLRWLGREFVRGDYRLKHLARVILNSHAYQRAVDPEARDSDPQFAAPHRRRLEAEQIVDSLFLAAGKKMATEEVNLDVDGGRDMKNSINLGVPRRAWEFASTSNERDRPSLALPRVQAVVDVLEAFGWRAARQFPQTDRDTDPNILQPAILANGTMGVWLTRLSDDHEVTRLALEDRPLDELVDRLFLRVLTRRPRPEERSAFMETLREGYDERIRRAPPPILKREPPRYVSWSNHLTPEANEIKVRLEERARQGAAPTNRLDPNWRARMEDALWALLNSPEFHFVP